MNISFTFSGGLLRFLSAGKELGFSQNQPNKGQWSFSSIYLFSDRSVINNSDQKTQVNIQRILTDSNDLINIYVYKSIHGCTDN